jgi:hypothetical protein
VDASDGCGKMKISFQDEDVLQDKDILKVTHLSCSFIAIGFTAEKARVEDAMHATRAAPIVNHAGA